MAVAHLWRYTNNQLFAVTVRLVMRKMHKKDVTTKLKALQEFLDLANTASEEDMLAVLTFWPSVYTKLAMDTDRRVREQVHIALAEVVKVRSSQCLRSGHISSTSGNGNIHAKSA